MVGLKLGIVEHKPRMLAIAQTNDIILASQMWNICLLYTYCVFLKYILPFSSYGKIISTLPYDEKFVYPAKWVARVIGLRGGYHIH
jgi:choline-glycine betaine transporter